MTDEMTGEDPRAGAVFRTEDNRCYVCGPGNPVGLGASFRLENGLCVGEFTPDPDLRGYDGVTHGGILFSLLDDVMANWLWLQGMVCFTARAEVRYRAPLPTGTPVRLEGRCIQRKGRLALMEGRVVRQDTGAVVAEASGSFMIQP